MAWVRVDERFSSGPKVKRAALRLGGKFPRRRVVSLWLDLMSYCNTHRTDGFIPDYEIAGLEDERPDAVIAAMAYGDEGMGAMLERDEVRGGWVVRNYLKYQPSKASVEEKAEIERKRKADYRASRSRPQDVPRHVPSMSQECPVGTNGDVPHVSQACPAPTEPNRTEPNRTEPVKSVSSEPAQTAASEPPLLTFPTVGTGAKSWALTASRLAQWREAYPGLDVMAECRKALAWCDANPTKRKTASGMPAFLVTWLNKSTNSGGPKLAAPANDARERNRLAFERVAARMVNS